MTSFLRLFVFLSGLLAAVAAHAAADLRLYGSNTVGAELAPAMVKAWLQAQHYNQISANQQGTHHVFIGTNAAGQSLTVELEAQGSSTGFTALEGQRADIAMSSRPISAQEVSALKKYGHCDTAACEYVLGLDGIAIIVNAANPLRGLDTETLRKVFSGQVKEWQQVGGNAGAIHIYALDENSGTFDTFDHLVMGGQTLVSGAKRDASHASIAYMVAHDPNGIGFVGLPFVGESKALAVYEGDTRPIVPSPFDVATEDYVLSRRLFFYLPESSASPLARSLVDFAMSDAGQQVVSNVGFVSQEILAGDEPVSQSAPEEYRQLTAGAKRLSVNFRFQQGQAYLDSKAQRDVARLKRFMDKPTNDHRELMLFGFADANESLSIVSLQLSMDRADLVADRLADQGMHAAKIRGLGGAVPVALNTSEQGRFKNRRVEVWLH